MDQSNNASVALLMLDIASAKSTLAQLQHTFSTAATEHQRTLHELDTLKRVMVSTSMMVTFTVCG